MVRSRRLLALLAKAGRPISQAAAAVPPKGTTSRNSVELAATDPSCISVFVSYLCKVTESVKRKID
jgi:hypothetical protein